MKQKNMDSVSLSTKSETQKRKRSQDDDSGDKGSAGPDLLIGDNLNLKRFQVTSDEDLISKFADHLLLEILSFLPAKEIVITSALSTRWRYLWTFFHIVRFDFRPRAEDRDCDSFLQRVERELVVLPDTARIRSLKLASSDHAFSSSEIPVDTLMSVISKAVKHEVEMLDVFLTGRSPVPLEFSLPHGFFTCKSLTYLWLYMPKVVNFPTSIYFPALKTLTLFNIKFEDEHSVQILLAGCPILENLNLYSCRWNHQTGITISIPTLKGLCIDIGNHLDTAIRISTPNLLNLSLTAGSRVELVPCDVSSVVEAKVCFHLRNYDVLIGNQTLKLLEAISGVKSLVLAGSALELITFQGDHLPTFYNLTHLDIFSWDGAALMQVLHKSPNLQYLHFRFEHHFDVSRLLQKNPVPVCFQRSLKNFTTKEFRSSVEEIRFLKYVLEHAKILEFISVNCGSKCRKAIECELKHLLRSDCVCNFT